MLKTITKTRVDTDSIDPARRIAAYIDGIDGILQTTFLSTPVRARLASCFLGPCHLIECHASPRRSERTAAAIARDRYDGICVQLAISGRSVGDASGRPVDSVPGTIMLLDFSQPFVMVDQEERDVINVAFPRAIFTRNIADVAALHGEVIDPARGALLAAHLTAMAPGLESMPVYAASVLADIVVDLLLIALDQDPAGNTASPADRRALLSMRARQVIDARLGSDSLTPEWLMAKLNISRSDLYGLFEGHGGVAKYIWRRRLEAARSALLDPYDTRRIGEIAFAHGFSSEAHFARAFKAAFETTAGTLRRNRG